MGDTFYDRIQLRRPNFATPYDIGREASIKSRLRLLDQLAEEGVPVHAYHMPSPAWAGSSEAGRPSAGPRRMPRMRLLAAITP